MGKENCIECGRPIFVVRNYLHKYVDGIPFCPKCYKKEIKKSIKKAKQKPAEKIFKNCLSCDGKGSIKGYTCQRCDGRGKYESVEKYKFELFPRLPIEGSLL